MRKTWGVVCVMALVGGCATSSGTQQETSTTPESSTGSGMNGEPTGSGVTPEQNDSIDALFRRKAPELQSCWTAEYEKNHDRKVEGDITLGMNIQPSGSAANVRILKSTINNASIQDCVKQAVTGWTFPELSSVVPYMRTVHIGAQF
ncbi:MAG: hypothetical protein JWN44_349 [Myxococcales bacterium]|nr:hypothetical protein [Myxococcales bacterium]